MKCLAGVLWMVVLALAAPVSAQSWPELKQERDELNKDFLRLWHEPLVWKFSELPIKGYVAADRVPYAGAIYPDNLGGTWQACRNYDRAFYGGANRAAAFESWDSRAHRVFAGRWRSYVPDWSGHCNGWTAASIRHAEPKYSVKHNGVLLTPKDIKGLLAEVYTFSDTVMIGGAYEYVINPAALHVSLTNWIGRHKHPIAMESAPGEEVWNFPIYAYNSTVKPHGSDVEVQVIIAYKQYLESEEHKAPANIKNMYFHYYLNLDKDGQITGGEYYGNSNVIDMLWVPLAPKQGGTKGNDSGNPYLKLDEVLAIWRKSVHNDQLISKWTNIDDTRNAAKPPNAVAKTSD